MKPAHFLLSLLFLSLLLTAGAGAEGFLFIESEPFGGQVRINGAGVSGRTPLLLELDPGLYTVRIEAQGFRSFSGVVEVEAGGAATLEAPLIPTYGIISFPEEGVAPTAVPDGPYRILRGAEGTIIEPVYPREARLRLFRVLSPSLLASAATASLITIALPPQEAEVAYIPVLSFQLSSLLFTGLTVREERRKTRFLDRWSPPENPYFPRRAETAAQEARGALERGNLDAAQQGYLELIEDYPRSPSVPEALFTLARLSLLEEDIESATEYLVALREEYPVPAYYDRATVELARIAADAGDSSRAEELLGELTGVDPEIDYARLEDLMSR